jgi:dihydrofolate reductase
MNKPYEHLFKIPIEIIVATDLYGGIGKNGKIPWINEPFAKKDLARFKKLTDKKAVVMGRKTAEDINSHTKGKFLPNRTAYVLSRNPDFQLLDADDNPHDNVVVVNSLRKAFEKSLFDLDTVVIGGERVFIEALAYNVEKIHLTLVDGMYNCDTFFPKNALALDKYSLVDGESIDGCKFLTYQKLK